MLKAIVLADPFVERVHKLLASGGGGDFNLYSGRKEARTFRATTLAVGSFSILSRLFKAKRPKSCLDTCCRSIQCFQAL